MTLEPVRSPRNSRLKAVRAVRAGRDREHVLLEGLHLIREALEAGAGIEWVLYEPGPGPAEEELLEDLRAAGVEVRDCPPALLREGSDLDSPRGLLGLARRPGTARRTLLEETARSRGVLLVAAGVQDPGNTGALVRAAAGLGATGFAALRGGASPWHPRALRGSAGTAFRLPVVEGWARETFLEEVGEAGLEILGAEAGGEDPARLPPARSGRVLLLGEEGRGLAPELRRACARRLGIPLHRGVESLNVATAAAVLLWELGRGREG